MAVGPIRALAKRFGAIDVLIGTGPDDPGALDVMLELQQNHHCIHKIYLNGVDDGKVHEVAIMAIPFDGRWRNGTHFFANHVLDGRPRPGDPNVVGLESWLKHETDYQYDVVRELTGEPPPLMTSFLPSTEGGDEDLVYLGLGFKRDAQSFWSKKHWGNDRFVRFIDEVTSLRPQTRFVTTGGNIDLPVILDIQRKTGSALKSMIIPIRQSFRTVAEAGSYFGNDTGMAHVAASLDRPVWMLTAFAGSEIKNHPYCNHYHCEPFHTVPREPEDLARYFVRYRWS